MKLTFKLLLVAGALSTASSLALGGQAPGSASAPDINATHSDRFYTSDQFSNTVSVVDPVDNKLLGVIKLGDPTPMNLSQLYRGQLVSMNVTEFEPIETTSNVWWSGENPMPWTSSWPGAMCCRPGLLAPGLPTPGDWSERRP